ncbi:elongation factor-2 kinase [Nannochloropsis oceanica]
MQAFVTSIFCRTKSDISSSTSASSTAVSDKPPRTPIPITVTDVNSTTDTYSFSFPKVLNKEEDEEGEDEEDDEDTVATALSNACITESAKEKEAMKDVPQLDLVFVVDSTSSMDAYIRAAQESIHGIITRLACDDGVSVRFALISYRDHAPQDSSYVTRVFPFTSHLPTITDNVNSITAEGGGDGPEAMADALYDLLHLEWRSSLPPSPSSSPSIQTSKVAVLIADAPPHGLGEREDGFPNGCPLHHDPLALTRQLAACGITLYTVGCEPAISTYENCKDILIFMAEATGGQALVLESASLLASVILAGAQEEVGLTRLEREVREVMREAGREAGEEEDEDVWVARVKEALRRKGTRTRQLKTNMRRMTSVQTEVIASCSSLEEAKRRLGSERAREVEEENGERVSISTGLSSRSFVSAAEAVAPVDMRWEADNSSSMPTSGVGWEGEREGGKGGGRGCGRLMVQDLISRRGGGGIISAPTVRAAPTHAAATTTTTVGAATPTSTAATEIPSAEATPKRGGLPRSREKELSASHTEATDTFPRTVVPTPCSSSVSSSSSPFLPAPLFSPTHTYSLTACATVGLLVIDVTASDSLVSLPWPHGLIMAGNNKPHP